MSDTIKAGKYELVATRFDQPTSKPNEPFEFVRHRRGDLVTLNAEDAERLLNAGAVVRPGELQRRAAEQARLAYEAALAAIPDAVRDDVLAGSADGLGAVVDQDGVEHVGVLPASMALPGERPKRTAPKAEWLAFRGVGDADAERFTIAELQDDELMDDWAKSQAAQTSDAS